MKIYFLSYVRAALKLDGEYVGIIDNFERYVDLNIDKGILAEIIPDKNLQPINFFICKSFFSSPPDFAEVYKAASFYAVVIKSYLSKDSTLKVILQQKFGSFTVTVYRQGRYFVSCEGQNFNTYPLPDVFENTHCKEVITGGKTLLALYGGKWLALINTDGKLVFLNEVESCSFGNTMGVNANIYSCTHSYAECDFSFDGNKFTAVNSRTVERLPQGENLLVFVFFERVLSCGDYENLLCDELKPKANSLKKYLGDFTAVTVPDSDFYNANPNEQAAGLVFKKGENLYEIIYFAIDAENGKITNIRPVQ